MESYIQNDLLKIGRAFRKVEEKFTTTAATAKVENLRYSENSQEINLHLHQEARHKERQMNALVAERINKIYQKDICRPLIAMLKNGEGISLPKLLEILEQLNLFKEAESLSKKIREENTRCQDKSQPLIDEKGKKLLPWHAEYPTHYNILRVQEQLKDTVDKLGSILLRFKEYLELTPEEKNATLICLESALKSYKDLNEGQKNENPRVLIFNRLINQHKEGETRGLDSEQLNAIFINTADFAYRVQTGEDYGVRLSIRATFRLRGQSMQEVLQKEFNLEKFSKLPQVGQL